MQPGEIDYSRPPGTESVNPGPAMRGRDGTPSDQNVAAAVRQAINNDQMLSSSARNVLVSSRGGIVTLSGQVQSVEDKSRIVSLAQQTPNVQAIEDRTVVQNR
jgi:osmotically-inducible protein OsmY